MKKIILLMITAIILSACTNEKVDVPEAKELVVENEKNKKIYFNSYQEFIKKYNESVHTLNNSGEDVPLMDYINEKEVDDLTIEEDGTIKQEIYRSEELQYENRYNLSILYDSKNNIEGYTIFSGSDLGNRDEDGNVFLSETGILMGYAVASALNIDLDFYDSNIQNSFDETIVSFNDSGYKITIITSFDVGTHYVTFTRE